MITLQQELNLEGYTFIVPSVAVANIAQLCVDLLISSLELRKIGQLWSPDFIPVVGADPYNASSTNIATTSDFYISSDKKILLLQIRSPFIGNSKEFFEELCNLVEKKKIAKTVILSSSYGYKRVPDPSNLGCPRYLASADIAIPNEQIFAELNWKKHDQEAITEDGSCIEGGGIAEPLHKYFFERKLPSLVLYRYSSEGDNVSDAVEFLGHINKWLTFFDLNDNCNLPIRYPPSWKNLFGNPPPISIY